MRLGIKSLGRAGFYPVTNFNTSWRRLHVYTRVICRSFPWPLPWMILRSPTTSDRPQFRTSANYPVSSQLLNGAMFAAANHLHRSETNVDDDRPLWRQWPHVEISRFYSIETVSTTYGRQIPSDISTAILHLEHRHAGKGREHDARPRHCLTASTNVGNLWTEWFSVSMECHLQNNLSTCKKTYFKI